MLKITFCPTCGSDKIKRVRKTLKRSVRGQSYTVPNLSYYECPDCGEHVYEPEAMEKIEARSPSFTKRRAWVRMGGEKKHYPVSNLRQSPD